ncbi:MAG TPA: endolytic transglycosylase MltG [Acidimicrobiales bacterium]
MTSRRPPRWLLITSFVVAGLMLILAVLGVYVGRRLDPPGPAGPPVALTIIEGATITDIANLLERHDVIADATVFRLYVRLTGAGGFQAGDYELPTNAAVTDVIDLLDAGPTLTFVKVTVPEGFTLDQILDRVDAADGLDGSLFEAALASGDVRSSLQPDGIELLEGLLFPDTYFIETQETEIDLLRRMVSLLDSTTSELGYDNSIDRVGLTPYETLIVASLVEREARVPEDRRKISRVIHNRLAAGQRLEIDATVLYALGEHKERVLFQDLEVDSPYNTYRVTGLPPTPIAVAGRAALEAAINPEPGPWLYYVVIDERGGHAFAETFSEHQANIRQAERNGVR